jgi:hypothetical protein
MTASRHRSLAAGLATARCALVPALSAALVLLSVVATQAGAAANTDRFTTVTPFSFPVINPCTGDTGTLSGIETQTIHGTDNPAHFLAQGTSHITEQFTPDNPSAPGATGIGVTHFTFVDNHAGGPPFSGITITTNVDTNVFHAPGITVVIHNTSHTTINDGTAITTVNKPVLVCQGL